MKCRGDDLLNFLGGGGTEGLFGEGLGLINRHLSDSVAYTGSQKWIQAEVPDAHSNQQAGDRGITGRFPAYGYGHPLVHGGPD